MNALDKKKKRRKKYEYNILLLCYLWSYNLTQLACDVQ